MRKAKSAAIAIGSAVTILAGGVFVTYNSSPVVGKAGPRESIEVYDVKNNVSAKIAALTSIRSTATTTGEANTIVRKAATVNESPAEFENFGIAATAAATEAATECAETTEAETAPNTEAATEELTDAPTEAVTQELTDAPTAAPVPATEAPATEAETAAPAAPAEPAPQTEAPVEPVPEVTEVITENFSEPVIEEISSEPAAEAVTETYVEPAVNTGLSDADYIMLCNAVAHEAGCDWISTYDKAKVVEVIMNRVYSPLYPDSIFGVLTQPYQFTGSSSYVYLSTYSCYVSQSVKDAVDLYFSDPSSFSHGYYSFWGDGSQNHFS